MKIYIIGRYFARSLAFGGFDTAVVGVVATQAEATAACHDPNYFYVERELGVLQHSGDVLADPARVQPSEQHTK